MFISFVLVGLSLSLGPKIDQLGKWRCAQIHQIDAHFQSANRWTRRFPQKISSWGRSETRRRPPRAALRDERRLLSIIAFAPADKKRPREIFDGARQSPILRVSYAP